MKQMEYPRKFLAAGWNVGIKDATPDFGVIHSELPATAAALFTKNNFPGNPVLVGREHAARGRLQTIVVNSKNSNVATGEPGLALARNMCLWSAEALGISPELVLPSSTGVIGRMPPEEKIGNGCRAIPSRLQGPDFPSFARAIMTTDTVEKLVSRELSSGIRITGVAKGAGMIEPNMATMLAYVVTDARMEREDLDRLIRAVGDRTFNRVSVDSDTSTSDTFVILANGAAEVPVSFSEEDRRRYDSLESPLPSGALQSDASLSPESGEFVEALTHICEELAKGIARDGEGATKLIQLKVEKARDRNQALKIGRAVINSPLFKTAVHGADPNWGRILMAVGKVFDEPVPLEKLRIRFGELLLDEKSGADLDSLSSYLKQEEVSITLSLGTGEASETLWGCDLTEEYVKINAYYTT